MITNSALKIVGQSNAIHNGFSKFEEVLVAVVVVVVVDDGVVVLDPYASSRAIW